MYAGSASSKTFPKSASVDVGADIPTAPFSMLRHPSEFWATVEPTQQPCKKEPVWERDDKWYHYENK